MTVQTAIPLVRMEIREQTATPSAGSYYEDSRGRMLLCLGPQAQGRYYWFIDAEFAPLIVKTALELAEEPVHRVDLVPSSGGPRC